MFSSIQSIPGLIFARSDVKAKIRPGVKATTNPVYNFHSTLKEIATLAITVNGIY